MNLNPEERRGGVGERRGCGGARSEPWKVRKRPAA